MQDGAHHVLVMNEHEGAIRPGNGQQAGFFKQVGDLVSYRGPQYGADAKNNLLQSRVLEAIVGQHFFDQALVARISKRVVAPNRIGFDQPFRVVRVVAVGRSTGRHDDALHTVLHAGVQDVAGAVHIHVVLEIALAVLARRHDAGQVNHHIGSMARHDAGQVG